MTALRHSFTHIKQLSSSFWVIISATLINQLGNMAMVFLVPYLTLHFHFTLPKASLIYASCCAGLLLSGIFAGSIADRVGAARLMIVVLFCNAFVLILIPFLNNFLAIQIMCFLWGLVFGLYRPAAQTELAHLAPRNSYKITFSIYRLAWNLGMSIGPVIGGFLVTYSFPMLFFFNGAANILAGIILIFGLMYKSRPNYPIPLTSPINLALGFKALKTDRTLRLLALGMIPVCMVFYQNSSTMPVFVHQDLHLSFSFYGLLFTVNTLMIVFFELPVNIATLSWTPKRSLTVGSLFLGLGFGCMVFASLPWHVLFLTVLWSIGEMILFPAANSYIAEIAPETSRGNYMSIFTTSLNVGLLLGPWSGAMLMHHFTSRGLWLGCALWALISIWIFQYLHQPCYDKLNQ